VLRAEGGGIVFRLGATDHADRAGLAAALAALPKERGLFVRVYGGVDVGSAAAAIQVARDAGFEAVTYVPGK